MGSYGAEGEQNGVSVAFGSLRPGEIGTATGRGLSPDPLKGVVSVVFDLQQAGSRNELAIALAHEGSHVADYQAFTAAMVTDPAAFTARSSVVGGPLDLTRYATETGAYGVSALTARGLGLVNYSIGGQRILDGGRGQPAAIRKFLGGSMLYKLTPANPGPRLSGQ